MESIKRLMVARVSSTRFDEQLGAWIGCLCGVATLLLGILKLTRLPLNETELFFGILLVVAVSSQMIGLGILASFKERIR